MGKKRRQWVIPDEVYNWLKEDAKRLKLEDRIGRYLEGLVEEVQALREKVKDLEGK